MTRPRLGFTLIELLVVIAIIAILAAILFPVFMTAKEKGKQAQCISNVKQISVGLLLYSDNWGNKIPSCYGLWHPEQGLNGGVFVFTDLDAPYVKSWNVYHCPSALWPGRLVTGDWQTSYLLMDVVFNYKYGNGYDRHFTSMSEFTHPAHTVILQDGDILTQPSWCPQTPDYANCGNLGYGGLPSDHVNMLNRVPVASKKIQAQNDAMFKNFCRHSNGSNCGFGDGHVKYIKSGAFTVSMFTK